MAAHIVLVTFTVAGGAALQVTHGDIDACTMMSLTAAEAHDDSHDFLVASGVNNRARLRSAVPAMMLPAPLASTAVHFAAVVTWLMAQVWPHGFIPGAPAPAMLGPIAPPVAGGGLPPPPLPPPPPAPAAAAAAIPPAVAAGVAVVAPPVAPMVAPPVALAPVAHPAPMVVAPVALAPVALAAPVVAPFPHPPPPPPVAVAAAVAAAAAGAGPTVTPPTPPKAPTEGFLRVLAPSANPALAWTPVLSGRLNLADIYHPASPPFNFSTELRAANVDLTHAVPIAIGRGILAAGFTYESIGIYQGPAGEITHYRVPHLPVGSLAMVAHAGHAANTFLHESIPGSASTSYRLGQERALRFALDCFNTFVSSVVIFQPSLEATAIMGWLAELFIRGHILVPPAPGMLGLPVNTDPCAQHVLRTVYPAVQYAAQARTLALVQESANATALLSAKFAREREEREAKEAAREAQRAREKANWEASKAATSAPSHRAKPEGSSKSRAREPRVREPAKCYYADDDEKDTVVVYSKVCPYHGPGHKASQCNVLLKAHGGTAETLNPRYKDVDSPRTVSPMQPPVSVSTPLNLPWLSPTSPLRGGDDHLPSTGR